MVAGGAAAIDSVATLRAGPGTAFVVAEIARGLRLASCVRVATAIARHDAYRTAPIDPSAVVFSTRRGGEWEEREQKA